jgi:hypothetical protein
VASTPLTGDVGVIRLRLMSSDRNINIHRSCSACMQVVKKKKKRKTNQGMPLPQGYQNIDNSVVPAPEIANTIVRKQDQEEKKRRKGLKAME